MRPQTLRVLLVHSAVQLSPLLLQGNNLAGDHLLNSYVLKANCGSKYLYMFSGLLWIQRAGRKWSLTVRLIDLSHGTNGTSTDHLRRARPPAELWMISVNKLLGLQLAHAYTKLSAAPDAWPSFWSFPDQVFQTTSYSQGGRRRLHYRAWLLNVQLPRPQETGMRQTPRRPSCRAPADPPRPPRAQCCHLSCGAGIVPSSPHSGLPFGYVYREGGLWSVIVFVRCVDEPCGIGCI